MAKKSPPKAAKFFRGTRNLTWIFELGKGGGSGALKFQKSSEKNQQWIGSTETLIFATFGGFETYNKEYK